MFDCVFDCGSVLECGWLWDILYPRVGVDVGVGIVLECGYQPVRSRGEYHNLIGVVFCVGESGSEWVIVGEYGDCLVGFLLGVLTGSILVLFLLWGWFGFWEGVS